MATNTSEPNEADSPNSQDTNIVLCINFSNEHDHFHDFRQSLNKQVASDVICNQEEITIEFDNKYYTADIGFRLYSAKDENEILKYASTAQALIIVIDDKESSWDKMKELWSDTISKKCSSEVKLICEYEDTTNSLEENPNILWSIKEHFEHIPMGEQHTDSGDEESDFIKDKTGTARILEALQAHVWDNLQKKGKKGKKKGAKDKEAGPKAGEIKEETEEPAYDKQAALENELNEVNGEIRQLREHISLLQKEHTMLIEETDRTKQESEEYISFMNKKTMKRQSMIISLGDKNKHELSEIEKLRQKEENEYRVRKEKVQMRLREKEGELSQVSQELSDLKRYQDLQIEQENEIKKLEADLEEMKFKHAKRTRDLKSKFLKDKEKFSREAEEKIKDMARDASKKAWECLGKHVLDVRDENEKLRHQLSSLVDQSNELQIRKRQLEKQHTELLRREQLKREMFQVSQKSKGFTLVSPTTSLVAIPQVHSDISNAVSFPRLSLT